MRVQVRICGLDNRCGGTLEREEGEREIEIDRERDIEIDREREREFSGSSSLHCSFLTPGS